MKLLRMKTRKTLLLLIAVSLWFLLLFFPDASIAEDRTAGNFFVNLRVYNEETIVSTPTHLKPLYRTAEVTAKYDAQDHGFKFSLVSNSIWSSNFIDSVGLIESYSAVNESGEEVPIRLIDTKDVKAVYLVKPDAGTYTINLSGSWTSGSISGEATLTVTFTVEKADLTDFFEVTPYSGVYDSVYHDAVTVSALADIGDYNVEYKTPDGGYSTTLPMVKTVAESGQYYCRISSESENFFESQYETPVNVSIRKKTATVTALNKVKCVGEIDPELESSTTGLAGSDQLSGLTLSRRSGENVGQYLISASLDAQSNPNYNVSLQTGVFTIRQHDWKEATYTWNSALSAVTALRICNYDSTHRETETVETTMVESDPTCMEPGKKVYTTKPFSNSAFAQQRKTVITAGALGHDWDDPIYVWAADYSSVSTSRTCKNDGNHIEEETKATTSEITTPATCTQMGKTTYTADNFENKAFTRQTKTVRNVGATGHDWPVPTYVWSEDYSAVTATRVCRNDSAHMETETVSAEESVTIAATCAEAGYVLYQSEEFDNEDFDAQEGRKELPRLDHTKVIDEAAKDATCTDDGNTEASHCSVCGTTLSEKTIIPASGHIKVIDEATVEPTCSADGTTEASHCSVCGKVLSEKQTIPANGHTIVIDPYVAPTTSQTGLTEGKHCSVCGLVIRQQMVIGKERFNLSACVKTIIPDGFELYEVTEDGKDFNNVLDENNPVVDMLIAFPINNRLSPTTIENRLKNNGFTIYRYAYLPMLDKDGKRLFDRSSGEYLVNPNEKVICAYKYSGGSYFYQAGFSVGDKFYHIITGSKTRSSAKACLDDVIDNMIVQHIYPENTGFIRPTQNEAGQTGEMYCTLCRGTIYPSNMIPALDDMNVLYLPDSLLRIEEAAFSHCVCQAIIIPQGCKRIEAKAFSNCDDLEYIFIPDSVDFVAEDAFDGCLKVVIDKQGQ